MSLRELFSHLNKNYNSLNTHTCSKLVLCNNYIVRFKKLHQLLYKCWAVYYKIKRKKEEWIDKGRLCYNVLFLLLKLILPNPTMNSLTSVMYKRSWKSIKQRFYQQLSFCWCFFCIFLPRAMYASYQICRRARKQHHVQYVLWVVYLLNM